MIKYYLNYNKAAGEKVQVELKPKNLLTPDVCGGGFLGFSIPVSSETVELRLYCTYASSYYGSLVAQLSKAITSYISVQVELGSSKTSAVISPYELSGLSGANVNRNQVSRIYVYKEQKLLFDISSNCSSYIGTIDYGSGEKGTITNPTNYFPIEYSPGETWGYPLTKIKPNIENNIALKLNGETYYLGYLITESSGSSGSSGNIPSSVYDNLTTSQKQETTQEGQQVKIGEFKSDNDTVTAPITVIDKNGNATDLTVSISGNNAGDYYTTMILSYDSDGNLTGAALLGGEGGRVTDSSGDLSTYKNGGTAILLNEISGSIYVVKDGIKTFYSPNGDGTYSDKNGNKVNIDLNTGTVTPVGGSSGGSSSGSTGGSYFTPPEGGWDYGDLGGSGGNDYMFPVPSLPPITGGGSSGETGGGDNTGSGENTGDGGEDSGGDSSGSESGSDSGSDSGSEGGE